MTNQVLKQKGLDNTNLSNYRNMAVRIMVALMALALIAVTVISLRHEPASTGSMPPATSIDLPFSTQQYWDMAAEYEAGKIAGVPAGTQSATYTQQYWDLASEHSLESAAGSPAKSQPSTYTQQYWDLAADHALRSAQAVQEAEPEWAYYTERYWSQIR